MQRSKLGSLFGNNSENDEGLDVLRYTAPKEISREVEPLPSTPTVTTTSLPPRVDEQQNNTDPKMVASATVRLYKFDAQRGSYDAIERGSPVGCVLLLQQGVYQLLVYNGLKATLAAAAITASFTYSYHESYLSFSTVSSTSATGVDNWSLLFDGVDALRLFLRMIVAVMAQLHLHHNIHTTSSSSGEGVVDSVFVVKHSLPPMVTLSDGSGVGGDMESVVSSAQGSASTALTAGMAAGVFYSTWALPDLSSSSLSSSSLTTERVVDELQPPADVLKVKLQQGVGVDHTSSSVSLPVRLKPTDLDNLLLFVDGADDDRDVTSSSLSGGGEGKGCYWSKVVVDMGGSILPVVLGNALLGAKKGDRWAVAFAVSLTAMGRQGAPYAHIGLTVWQQPQRDGRDSSDGGSEWLVVFAEVDVAKVRQRSSASATSKSTASSSSSGSSSSGDAGVNGNHSSSLSVSFSSAPPNVYDSLISNAGTGTMTGSSSDGGSSSVDDEQAGTEIQQPQQPQPQPSQQGQGSDSTGGSVSDLAARMAKIGGVGVGLHMAAAVAANRSSAGAEAPSSSDGTSSNSGCGADALPALASTAVSLGAQPSSSSLITTTNTSAASSRNSALTHPNPVSEGSGLASDPLRSPTLPNTHAADHRPVVRDEEGLGQQLALVLAQLSALRSDVNTLLTLEDADEEEEEEEDCGNDDDDEDDDEDEDDADNDDDAENIGATEVKGDGDGGQSVSSRQNGWSCAGRGTRVRGTRIISSVRKLVGDFGLALSRARRQARVRLRTELTAAQSREDRLRAEAEAAASAAMANNGGPLTATSSSSVAESSTLQALRLTIERLEAKNEALQTRADRLMEEKVELLTRTAAATATALAMQQQMEAMRLASSSSKDKEKDTITATDSSVAMLASIDGATPGTGGANDAVSQIQSPQASTVMTPSITSTTTAVVGGGGSTSTITNEEGDGTWSTVAPVGSNNNNGNGNGSNAKKKKGKK